jgi:IS30 family transposase
MVYYKRLSLYEREKIYLFKQNNKTQTEIALLLGRSQSTISYELKRCPGGLVYLPDRANIDARSKDKRYNGKIAIDALKNHIIFRLKQKWSPEQIASRLKYERSSFRISHEAIYQYIYSEEGRRKKLSLLLLRRRPKRGSRYGKKPAKHYIPESCRIEKRPDHINKRKEKGHWEGDLVVFTILKSSNVTTLLERKSRYVELIYNPNKYSKTVIGNIDKRLSNMPLDLRKTITFDRGKEFAKYNDLDMDVYFCNPHSPWEKGSNENFNGRLRRYLPKRFDHRDLNQKLLDQIQLKMNNTPRKCLGFKTPIEALFHQTSNPKYLLDP